MKKLSQISRIILALGSLSVIACFWLPLWEIKLWAPQYPEGLSIEIWHNALKGDVEVINGLNHYIGMKHLKAEMFPEFIYLKFIIGGFIIWGLIVALVGNMRFLSFYVISLILGGVTALLDFYRWGYDYGHNLDPTAPIQVPGMVYQPPVIGYKDLLNFTALSIPSTGGWIVVALGAFAISLFTFEWMKSKKVNNKILLLICLFSTLFFINSCGKKEISINYGKADCDFCKMKIMDNKFGVLLFNDKGRKYQFDDMNCFIRYKEENKTNSQEVYVSCLNTPGQFIPANNGFYIESELIKTPMSSGIAAFSSKVSADTYSKEINANVIDWNEIIK
jgi:copper chaperone NosL